MSLHIQKAAQQVLRQKPNLGGDVSQVPAQERPQFIQDVAQAAQVSPVEAREALLQLWAGANFAKHDAGKQIAKGNVANGFEQRSLDKGNGVVGGGMGAQLFAMTNASTTASTSATTSTSKASASQKAAEADPNLDLKKLDDAGHKYETFFHKSGGVEHPAVRFLPDKNGSRMNKIAARMKEMWGMELAFSPSYLKAENANGVFFGRDRLMMDVGAAYSDKHTPTLLHEMRHAYYQHQRNTGKASVHDVSLHAAYPRHNISTKSDVYTRYQSAEELATFAKGSFQSRPRVKSHHDFPQFPTSFTSNVSRTVKLAQQTSHAVDAVLEKLDDVLQSKNLSELERKLDASKLFQVSSPDDGLKVRGKMSFVSAPRVTKKDHAEHDELTEAKKALEDFTGLQKLFSGKAVKQAKSRTFDAQMQVLSSLKDKLSNLQSHADNLSEAASPLAQKLDAHESFAWTSKSGWYDDKQIKAAATEALGDGAQALDGLEGDALRAKAKDLVRENYDALFDTLNTQTSRLSRMVSEVDGKRAKMS